MRVPLTVYRGMVERGLLEPLDRFLDDPEVGLDAAERADFAAAVWNPLAVDGQRYAIPSDYAQWGLYYNRALFDAAGEPHPDEDWTWADLEAAAGRLTASSGGDIETFGLDLWVSPTIWLALLIQAGGEPWDAACTTTLIDSPEGLEALRHLTRLTPHVPAVRATTSGNAATGPDKLFAAGRTAMLIDGSWRAPALELASPDLDFAIAPLPRHRRRVAVGHSVLWAISAHAEHKDAAWEMIRWMTGPEQSLRYWDVLRVAPPSRVSVVRSEGFRQTAGLVVEGEVLSPPMPRAAFDARAAWLLQGMQPHPETGEAPGRIFSAYYHRDLARAVHRMLQAALSPDRDESLEDLLAEAAGEVHSTIDRDRRTRGLEAVGR